MIVRPAQPADAARWQSLRAILWHDDDPDDHRAEIATYFTASNPEQAAFMAVSDGGDIIGFAEAALRHDYVEACDTSPVAYLEGICVDPAGRLKGVGRMLVEAVADWGRAQGCTEFASDALIEDVESHAFHAAVGLAETERVVFFKRDLQ
ncbi:aminoglycoside 6'-N-acetyltransferase [Sphingomonas sp. SUN039]|uniref:aminoglycoside 6'-N-acetyltransferase n=1 Tax=Sphingomonas sp. SUN039 TaxID=2937787 RepID=UPI002164E2D4|nr:aminoglycoside 6'-N-acetyltransferase [Sphingomonas sp. SUN039]UVO54828.1 GNAT family N-acetyltransferase [Sphingomonas sp. SUN039]